MFKRNLNPKYCFTSNYSDQEIAKVVAPILPKYNVPETRIPFEKNIPSCDWIESIRKNFYLKVCQESLLSYQTFRRYKIKFIENFVGLSVMGKDLTVNKTTAALIKVFEIFEVKRNIYCELMVHPGYVSNEGEGGCIGTNGPDEFSRSPERRHEFDFLQSMEWTNLITQMDITIECKKLHP